MFARLRIAKGEPQARVLVPQDIIGTELTRKYVYVLDSENKAKRKYVTLGAVAKDGLQIIKTGLDKEDRVIVGGFHMVQPATQIMPIEADAENKPKETH